MNAERWRQIDDLFQEALEIDPDGRTAFVRRRGADDADLVREVLSLLEAGRREDVFLDRPAHGGVSAMIDLDASDDALLDLAGQRLGAYRLQTLIATGGMGAVYLATRDDDQYEKQVAVKLVRRAGAGSSTNWRDDLNWRFKLERQVLASLDHPNIARLLDGGTTADGRPYFVMEHVAGRPIDAWCDEHRLTTGQRIDLFLRVCDAVHYAHRNLVLHRDLKPGNILVQEAADDNGSASPGEPKLLDFGLAKLIDPHREPVAGGATVTGAFMGTFAYAAPEQVRGTGGQQDTRSDVYSLGLVLYRLLAGRHAYTVEGNMSEVLRTITESNPPPPSQFNRTVGGELDTIVLKTLAKEPSRRYESIGALAADLRRHRAGEPVLAKSDSRLYVLRKTARRYRVPLTIAAAALILVSAFAIVVSLQSRQLAVRSVALASALRASNIERGRLMGRSGDVALAERIIWDEWQTETTSRDASAGTAHWALWELYASYPCVRSVRHGSQQAPRVKVLADGTTCVMYGASDSGPGVVDMVTGLVRTTLDCGYPYAVFDVGFDGRSIVTGTPEGRVDLWEGTTGARRSRIDASPGLRSVALSPDGARVACGVPGAVEIRALSGDEPVVTTPHEGAVVQALAFTPDGDRLLGNNSDALHLWDGRSGTLLAARRGFSRSPQTLAISPGGRYVARCGVGSDVDVFDLETLEPVATLAGAKGFVNTLEFHPRRADTPWLAVGSVDRTVRVWEIPDGQLVTAYTGHNSPQVAADFTPDGEWLVTVGQDGLLRIWEMASWRCLTRWEQSTTVFNARFSPDGSIVAVCYGDGVHIVRLLDATTGEVRRELTGHEEDVSSIAFSHDGRTLASASFDRTVHFWSLEGDSGVVIAGDVGRVNALAFGPDGERIVVARDETDAIIVDRRSGAILERIDVSATRIPSIDWTRDGRLIAMATWPGHRIILVDAATGTQRVIGVHEQRPRIVRFSGDGRMLATSGDDGIVMLWPVDGGEPTALRGHQQGIFALDFSPDDRRLASGGRSGRIRVWDVDSRQTLATLPKHGDIIFTLDFSHDGRTLISGSRDRSLGLWDLTYYDRHIEGNAGVFGGGHRGR